MQFVSTSNLEQWQADGPKMTHAEPPSSNCYCRLSTVRDADCIAMVVKGCIVEQVCYRAAL